ncbi:hypothetical protein ACIBJD_15205 [Kitasatospora sp. NPDC050467]|uniref:hypothetical protein n=1 Tax=Kitasatospora sp. NPDC050467 TaxID=3364053 RepID=UPI0037B81F02
MIQIRVICDVNDVPFVVTDLCRLWHVHDVKECPEGESGRRRLDLTVTCRATSTG